MGHSVASVMTHTTHNAVTIPRRFFDDHAERDLPTPEIISETSRSVTISRDDAAFPELVNDCEYYAHEDGPAALKREARALLRALQVGGAT